MSMSVGHTCIKRLLAQAVIFSLTWAQLAAAATDLGDVPMATQGRAKPNLILVVDDSGSMDGEFLPTKGYSTNDGAAWWNTTSRSFIGYSSDGSSDIWLGGGSTPSTGGTGFFNTSPPTGPINFNQAGNSSSTWKKYVYLFPNGQCGSNCDTRGYADASNDHFAIPPTREFGWARSHLYNAQYYNPSINYEPWRPYNNGSTTSTPTSYDSSSAWSAVRSHPIYPTSGSPTTIDLTSNVPEPGDSYAGNRVFVMYTGMILPAGSRYRLCRQDGAYCGSWTNGPSSNDVCLVSGSSDTASYCHFASLYGVSSTLAVGTSGGYPQRVEAQISYYPTTYWIKSSSTGTLQADEAYGPDGQRIKRVEIRSSTPSYTKAATRTDCAGATCSYAEEMTNFANWWGYYRKRHMMLNGALGLAFDQLTGLRAGYFLFNSLSNVTMRDFDNSSDTQNAKRLLYDLYRTKGTGGTPTRDALEYAGRQFQRTDSNAPINAVCQFNAAFVITDGFASNNAPPTSFSNVDGDSSNRFTIPYDVNNADLNYTDATPAGNIPLPPTDPLPSVTVTPVHPFADSESNTLADIAMYFYSNNVRPDLSKRQVSIERSNEGPDSDRNDYLHMNTYALGLGVQGMLFGRTDTADLIKINENPFDTSVSWSWPNVRSGSGYVNRHPAAIDELWHATIDGRGMMLSASSPEETRVGVVDIVNNVGAKGGAGAAVAVANPNVVPGDNYSYASSYNSGPWSGDINKYAIDTSTGAVGTTPLWSPSPQKQLATRLPGTRVIASYDGSSGIPFEWTDLTAAQKSVLTSTVGGVTASDPDVLAFLRGDRSLEVERFRSRGPRPQIDPATGDYAVSNGKYVYQNNRIPDDIAVLGDIVNGEPVVVRGPRFSYFDNGYQDFKTTYASRTGVVYQGANDGMLHAFDATTGAELWAYVPSLLFGNLRNLSDRLSFHHLYYVDGTPSVGDIDFSYTPGANLSSPGTPDWRTVLVSGLRKGGFGYFAIDVTNPTMGNEASLASKVLWEFPSAATDLADPTIRPNVGYSFGKPLIVKTRAAGWVVVVSSGYNNGTGTGSSGGDGVGRVWILNPVNGNVIKELSTNVGSSSSPSGLAHLSAFAQRGDVDATTDAVYGGDLRGNVWRFDLSGASTTSWYVAKVATLKDGTGQTQPVTVEPELGVIQNKRVIFVGTGEYLGDSDVLNSATENTSVSRQTQSFYALRDDPSYTSISTPLISGRSALQQQTATKTADSVDITSTNVSFVDKSGWFFDLPDTGERVVTNPVLSGGVLAFTSNIPDGSDACNPGGSSWLYFVDYATGGTISGATSAGSKLGSFLSSRPVLIKLPSGEIVGLVRTSNASTVNKDLPSKPNSTTGRRVSWREVPDTNEVP
ncbi:MAG: PQQ-binding-like beta-propeller repeat protein [Betaproteobacteria bacterium]|nr:PQQ-binding-like beta-propeller repeat protein [Betaproteobacteria bacterium]